MPTRHLMPSCLAILLLVVAGCGGGETKTSELEVDIPPAADSGDTEPAAAREKPTVTVPSGPPPKELKIRDVKEGTGATAKKGSEVLVDYVGVAHSTGKEFDTSFKAGGAALPVTLGAGGVIAGWDEGIPGMKVGGRRELIIPPDMAYGARGFPPDIKPNETLVFVVDLVDAH